ncbi:MAG: DsbA family oxidoreductase [Polyangiaceae bacterium]|nr:DsbA family oxidoreductase [Polyangiaceae bacterium]
MKNLQIDVWSDVACPWCYVGKRRLEAALTGFAHKDNVTVRWHSFELDPAAPRNIDLTVSYAARLAKKYGSSVGEAEGMIRRMVGVAKGDGLNMDFEKIRPGNTFDAHRLLHFAAEKGCQNEMKERLMRAYFCEGEAVGERATLVQLAASVGLDPDLVAGVLESDQFASDVREDEGTAREIGIRGVPFFILNGKVAVSGAQPAELFAQALKKAWDEMAAAPDVLSEGAACGPEGCA